MPKITNKLVKNRPSPRNESKYIEAYKERNPKACRPDGKDISAVTDKNGNPGYALLPEKFNRSKDTSYHRGKDFILASELRKGMKK